jgi:hypothetical protein
MNEDSKTDVLEAVIISNTNRPYYQQWEPHEFVIREQVRVLKFCDRPLTTMHF